MVFLAEREEIKNHIKEKLGEGMSPAELRPALKEVNLQIKKVPARQKIYREKSWTSFGLVQKNNQSVVEKETYQNSDNLAELKKSVILADP